MKNSFSQLAFASLTACILFLSSACKKETPPTPSPNPTPTNNTSQYFIHFKIDGVEHTYVSEANGSYVNLPPTQPGDTMLYSMMTGNAVANDYTHNGFGISAINPHSLTTNVTYTNYTPSAGTEQKLYQLAFTYTDENGVNSTNLGEPLFASAGLICDGRLNISVLTATEVRATFSASLYDSTLSTVTHHLTDGELFVHRIQ